MSKRNWFLLGMLFSTMQVVHAQEGNNPPGMIQINYKPSARPDRIMLTWTENSANTQTVTWRTDSTCVSPIAEFAVSEPSPDFTGSVQKVVPITTQQLQDLNGTKVLYHTATFRNLLPNTTYVYRVGNQQFWSEWIQFRTAEEENRPYSFLYMGDAQNKIFFHWSRVIRAAYAREPNARFILHAGDLINNAGNDYEWGEWFEAANFINRSIPVIATPGNHEYYKNEQGHKTGISKLWKPQFKFPENGVKGLESSCYYIDYKSSRVICLNSNERIEEQAIWLEQVLKNNPQQWTFVTFHHPVLSASKGRVNEGVFKNWKPILDRYKVDLVLQGHDHSYARGTNFGMDRNSGKKNSGTVYVVSVCGPKMYQLEKQDWMESYANNTQLYQAIKVDGDRLTYRAYTVDGKVYDAFEIQKKQNRDNRITDLPVEVARRY